MCDQQRLRPACAYAQSDQNLCQSLEYSMTVKLLTKQHLEFLSLKGGCTDSSESTLSKCHIVGNHMLRLIWPFNFKTDPQQSSWLSLLQVLSPVPKVIKLFPCSTQLNTKFQMLIKTQIPTNEEFSCFRSLIYCIYPANKSLS